jgi:2-polyprenyl-3-methyl-5-hydroxy-6-metoxy-1,4-benzoquinol methylase
VTGLGQLASRARALGARVSSALPPPPFMAALSQQESTLAAELLERHAEELKAAKAPGRGEAREALAARLVTELRIRMENIPRDRPLLSLVGRLDAKLPVDTIEYMDDARIEWSARTKIIGVLEKMTHRSGDYLILSDVVSRWYDAVAEASPGAGAPAAPSAIEPVILDIASGSGGFMVALAGRPHRPRNVRLVASDIGADYLELGRLRAQEAGVADVVSFRRLDAFRLARELGAERPALITCTRSLHHFGVGGTLRLLEQAVASARRGVIFIDIARSLSRFFMAGAAGVASGSWRFAHDAAVSVRKSFTLEELRLIAQCTPGAERAEITFLSPAYLVLKIATAGRGG